ncbi:hypothetical protein GALMADRAFT_143273 [Galerina marginata CBS 339.88]|uniref:Uncharacterized protein n=1 Tax=Galerina marginata (strain CBS 339.88) TaxID=685588 RepID=A0A067SNG7_GALM3|nr:hypothetical protein GALMADRAFT_143273 [Galerina marginata CBS 339.88]
MLRLSRPNSPAPPSFKVVTNRLFGALGRSLQESVTESSHAGHSSSSPEAETLAARRLGIQDIIDLALPPLNKSRIAYPQESSKGNIIYHGIVFRFTPLQLSAVQPLMDRAHGAINYLANSGFEWLDVGGVDMAYHERDVSKRNETAVIPLLIQLGNSLCPENYAVAHFTQATQPSGRIDHIITLHRLVEPLTASQLQDQDADVIFKRPKRWSILGQEDVGNGSVQALLGIEDKLTITPNTWSEAEDSNSQIGNLDSEEVKWYTAQILKLFKHPYVTLNDGNSYITFHIDRTDLEALVKADNEAMPPVMNAKYIIYRPDNVRRGLFLSLFAGLEDAFGNFTGSGWESAPKIRGPVSLVKRIDRK